MSPPTVGGLMAEAFPAADRLHRRRSLLTAADEGPSDRCEASKPSEEVEEASVTIGSTSFLEVTCDFAIKSAIAAGSTGEETCKVFAALTLNEMAAQWRKQPATSDFQLSRDYTMDPDAPAKCDTMHVIDVCEKQCYLYRVGPCFPSYEGPALLAAVTIAIVLVVLVCVLLKKRKRCCFRARTQLPSEVTQVGDVSSTTNVSVGPISSQSLELPYTEMP